MLIAAYMRSLTKSSSVYFQKHSENLTRKKKHY